MSLDSAAQLERLVRLSRHATGADFALFVIDDGESINEISAGVAPELSIPRAATAFNSRAVGVGTETEMLAGYAGFYAALPVTGPSAEAGWLLVLSADETRMNHDALDVLDNTVDLIEHCLDQSLERLRLDQLSEVLQASQTALRSAQARLVVSNNELEQFAYVAAHELLSPLRSVVVYAELLEQSARDLSEAQIESCVDEIRSGVARMDRQLNSLLELSSTQREATDAAPVELDGVVSSVAHELDQLIVESGTSLEVGELPVVIGRPALLQSVFTNLISNAIKYRDPQRQLKVSISSETNDHGSTVYVTDNGPGVADENQGRIFQLFERASANTPGSGIGLGLSRRIIEAFGGTINYEAATDGGSTFAIAFPSLDPIKT